MLVKFIRRWWSLIALLTVAILMVDSSAFGEVPAYGDPLPPGVAVRLGTPRLNHKNEICRVAIDPQGDRIATLGRSSVTIWDAATGRVVDRWSQQFQACRSIDYSRDGRYLLVVDANRLAYVYDAKTGRRLHTLQDLPDARTFHNGQFSPVDDKEFLIASGDGVVRIWRLDDGRLENTSRINFACLAAVYAADGKSLIGRGARSIRVVDKSSGNERFALLGHEKPISQVRISPDNRWIASSSDDGSLRLWDANTGRAVWIQEGAHEGREVRSVAFSPDGNQLLSSGEDNTIRVWDVRTRKPMRSFKGLRYARWSPDAARIVSFDGISEIRIHDALTGEPRRDLIGHGDRIHDVVFFDEGKQVATYTTGRLRIWDRATGRALHKFHDIRHFAVVPQHRMIAAIQQNRVILFDLASGEQRELTKPIEAGREYDKIVVSPDGSRLVTVERISTADDGARKRPETRITSWALPEGKALSSVEVGLLHQIKFLADSRRVVMADTRIGTDGVVPGQTRMELIEIWPVDDGKRTKRIHVGENCPARSAVFSQSGDRVALRDRRTKKLEVYDLNTGEGVRGFAADGQTSVGYIQTSADGRWIVTGMGTFYIWDASDGKLLHEVHTSGRVCALSPDKTLLAATGEYDFALWDIASGKRLVQKAGIGQNPSMVTFTPDGKQIMLRADDCCLWLWDLDRLLNPPTPTAASLADLWKQLGDTNAKTAYRAAEALIGHEHKTVEFLADELDVMKRWPALPSGADPVTLQHDRARFVLDQIGTEAARQLRSRITIRDDEPDAGVAAPASDGGEQRLPRGAVAQFGTDAYRMNAGSDVLLAFSRDGKLFATIEPSRFGGRRGERRQVRIWDVQTGRHVRSVSGPTFRPRWMGLLPDSKSLVCADREQLEIVDIHTGEVSSRWTSDVRIDACAVTADGETMVTGHRNGRIHLRQLATGKVIRSAKLSEATIIGLRNLGDTKNVAVLTSSRQGAVWNTVSGEWLCPPLAGNYGFSSDGRFYARRGNSMDILRVETGKPLDVSYRFSHLAPLAMKRGNNRIVVFDTLGKWFGLFEPGGDGRILDGHTGLVLSPDGNLLAVPRGRQLTVWDLRTGQDLTLRANQKSKTTDVVVASSDGRRILTMCNGQVQLRDPDTFRTRTTLPMLGTPVALSHDGRFCATIGRNHQAMVCETATGTEIARLLKVSYHDLRATFHPAQPRVIFADTYGPAMAVEFTARKARYFWNTNNGKHPIQLAADGKTAICQLEHEVLFRDTQTGESLWALKDENARSWDPRRVSDDGRWIFVRSENGVHQLLDIRTGKSVASTNRDFAASLAWSPDWSIYVASEAGVTTVRDTESGTSLFRLDARDVASARILPVGRHILTDGDGVKTVWDLASAAVPRNPGESTTEQLARLWPALASDDARAAFEAEWAFVVAKQAAVEFVAVERRGWKEHLREVDRLIEQLDDDSFRIRRSAQRKLEALGPLVAGPLRQALSETGSAEVRSRARRILDRLQHSPAMLREARVARILRRIDTAEARLLADKIASDH